MHYHVPARGRLAPVHRFLPLTHGGGSINVLKAPSWYSVTLDRSCCSCKHPRFGHPQFRLLQTRDAHVHMQEG